MRVLDLFSGVGGFSLGLERAGMTTVAFCEIEPYCRAVLAKHWPGVPIYGDIRELTAERLRADGISVDLICGGFPCQDVSVAGKRAGLGETRSGLWADFSRLVNELRPRYAIVENTPGLLSLGMGTVLGDLAEIGYDCEWHCIPARAVGAYHFRDRVWIVAHPDSDGPQEREHESRAGCEAPSCEYAGRSADGIPASKEPADPQRWQRPLGRHSGRMGRLYKSVPWNRDWPLTAEPVLGRGTHGVPNRVDRLKALGNAVVPQIPEIIGRAILGVNDMRASTGRANREITT